LFIKSPEDNKLISIAIPVYEMHGNGYNFLNFSFSKILSQTYKNIQIVISDHSLNNNIEILCKSWSNDLNIKYLRNEFKRGSSSSNINNAINNCDGQLIKILFQDDFFYDDKSIENIVEAFDQNDEWLVCACTHTQNGTSFYNEFYPSWNYNMIKGVNTISSPSVLTIKNHKKERFDNNLIWLMDCDFYTQLYIKYGPPKILNTICIVNRIWGNRLSDTIETLTKKKEKVYLAKKYHNSNYLLELTIYYLAYFKNLTKKYFN
jgi:hypothetical protein